MKITYISGATFTQLILVVEGGVYRIDHEDPSVMFGVMVYGLKEGESYAYPGGLRLTETGEKEMLNITIV